MSVHSRGWELCTEVSSHILAENVLETNRMIVEWTTEYCEYMPNTDSHLFVYLTKSLNYLLITTFTSRSKRRLPTVRRPQINLVSIQLSKFNFRWLHKRPKCSQEHASCSSKRTPEMFQNASIISYPILVWSNSSLFMGNIHNETDCINGSRFVYRMNCLMEDLMTW